MTISYSFEQSVMKVVNGEKTRVSHSIVDGDKGATFYYLNKDAKSFKKVKIIEKEGKFEVKMKLSDGGEEQSMELDDKGFKDMVKKDKDLAFIVDYLKEAKKSGGARAKKTSKKTVKRQVKRPVKK